MVESVGEQVETVERRNAGTFEPGPIRDPGDWRTAQSLTRDEANLIRAAWSYLDAVQGSDWLAEVHLIWALENALIEQDISFVKELTVEYLAEVGNVTVSSKDEREWKAALTTLKQACEIYKQ